MAKALPRGAPGDAGKGSLGRAACGGPMRSSPEGSGPGLGGSHYEVSCSHQAEVSTCLHSPWKGLPPTPASPHLHELMGREALATVTGSRGDQNSLVGVYN